MNQAELATSKKIPPFLTYPFSQTEQRLNFLQQKHTRIDQTPNIGKQLHQPANTLKTRNFFFKMGLLNSSFLHWQQAKMSYLNFVYPLVLH